MVVLLVQLFTHPCLIGFTGFEEANWFNGITHMVHLSLPLIGGCYQNFSGGPGLNGKQGWHSGTDRVLACSIALRVRGGVHHFFFLDSFAGVSGEKPGENLADP